MTAALWLVVAVVVSFCAWTLAVFLLPNDTSDEDHDK